MVEDGIVGVIGFQKVLDRSCFSFWLYFEVEDGDWLEVDGLVVSPSQEAWESKWEAECREHIELSILGRVP